MQEYKRSVTIINRGLPTKARLKVVRLPGSWYAVLWKDAEHYQTFSQDWAEDCQSMTDEQFLSRVQLVASVVCGFDFLLDAAAPPKRKKRITRRKVRRKRPTSLEFEYPIEFDLPHWEPMQPRREE
jgi:hypothetical protein